MYKRETKISRPIEGPEPGLQKLAKHEVQNQNQLREWERGSGTGALKHGHERSGRHRKSG